MAGAVWRSPSKGQQKGRAGRAPESARLTEAAGQGEMEDGARCSTGTELSLRIEHTTPNTPNTPAPAASLQSAVLGGGKGLHQEPPQSKPLCDS